MATVDVAIIGPALPAIQSDISADYLGMNAMLTGLLIFRSLPVLVSLPVPVSILRTAMLSDF